METTETLDQFDALNLNDHSKKYLTEIAKWSSFFAILTFIFIGLLVVGCIAILAVNPFERYSELANNPQFGGLGALSSSLIVFVYLIFGLLYFMPAYYLFKSSKSLKTAIKTNDSNLLEVGFSNLKSCFKFWGIFTIIVLGFYVIIFLFAGLAAFAF